METLMIVVKIPNQETTGRPMNLPRTTGGADSNNSLRR
jgi:hypothetical protein